MFSCSQGVAGGVLRGAGKQKIGALCNLVGYYFIGFPIGVSLMFAAKMGIVGKTLLLIITCVLLIKQHLINVSFVSGLWTGLTICVVMQAIFFIAFLYKLDWNKAAEEVSTSVSPLIIPNCELKILLMF